MLVLVVSLALVVCVYVFVYLVVIEHVRVCLTILDFVGGEIVLFSS